MGRKSSLASVRETPLNLSRLHPMSSNSAAPSDAQRSSSAFVLTHANGDLRSLVCDQQLWFPASSEHVSVSQDLLPIYSARNAFCMR